jgi:class I fructose-bisphosphate aldolase
MEGVEPKDVLLKNGHGLLLAYDQGFEHGLADFNDANIDPAYIVKIAKESGVFTGIIFQKGIAEKYYIRKTETVTEAGNLPPLIVKLNGKTSFHTDEEPYSPPVCTVDEAIALGAKGVGFTIYPGSEYEAQMMREFGPLQEEAHAKGLPVIGWMYPRGKHVLGREDNPVIVSYAARLGLELGCDFVKVHYTGSVDSFTTVVKSAGKVGVFVSGGVKTVDKAILAETQEAMAAGAVGLAVGRNVWQNEDPVGMSRKLAQVIFG